MRRNSTKTTKGQWLEELRLTMAILAVVAIPVSITYILWSAYSSLLWYTPYASLSQEAWINLAFAEKVIMIPPAEAISLLTHWVMLAYLPAAVLALVINSLRLPSRGRASRRSSVDPSANATLQVPSGGSAYPTAPAPFSEIR